MGTERRTWAERIAAPFWAMAGWLFGTWRPSSLWGEHARRRRKRQQCVVSDATIDAIRPHYLQHRKERESMLRRLFTPTKADYLMMEGDLFDAMARNPKLPSGQIAREVENAALKNVPSGLKVPIGPDPGVYLRG